MGAVTFPMFCGHCRQTYWYAPNERWDSGDVPAECVAWVTALREGHEHDQGRDWWAYLVQTEREAGRREASSKIKRAVLKALGVEDI